MYPQETNPGGEPPPFEVYRYLEGAVFPSSKEQLVQIARHNSAPETVIVTLRELPRDWFLEVTEVARAMAER